jgi:hypothetical protein
MRGQGYAHVALGCQPRREPHTIPSENERASRQDASLAVPRTASVARGCCFVPACARLLTGYPCLLICSVLAAKLSGVSTAAASDRPLPGLEPGLP